MTKTGRYDQIPRDNRLCPTCGSNQIEDEIPLFFHCPKWLNFQENRVPPTKYKTNIYIIEATKELTNSDNYFVNMQVMRFILPC